MIIGYALIIIDITALVIISIIVLKAGVYKGDFINLLLDSWEVIGLFIVILLLGIVLIRIG